MDKIILDNVLPHVFEGQALDSGIWQSKPIFEKDKLYLVLADSGKGKSTFCSYILGYRHDYTGTILFDSTDVKGYKVRDWVDVRRVHISHLFQELRLFPELTAMENIQIKNRIPSVSDRTDYVDMEKINHWFERLGIADKKDAKVGRMSFGQQQRVAMIRSLVQPFDFLLVDEPISHLDDTNSAIMADIMMQEAKAQHAGVIVTSIGKHMQLNYDKVYKL